MKSEEHRRDTTRYYHRVTERNLDGSVSHSIRMYENGPPRELVSSVPTYRRIVSELAGLTSEESGRLTITGVYKGKTEESILVQTHYLDDVPSSKLSQLRGMVVDINRKVKVSTGFTFTIQAGCDSKEGLNVVNGKIVVDLITKGNPMDGKPIVFDPLEPGFKMRYYNQGQAVSVFRWEGDTFFVGLNNLNIKNPASKFRGANVWEVFTKMNLINIDNLFPANAKYWPICYRFFVSTYRNFSATRLRCPKDGYITFLGGNMTWIESEKPGRSFIWGEGDSDYHVGLTKEEFLDREKIMMRHDDEGDVVYESTEPDYTEAVYAATIDRDYIVHDVVSGAVRPFINVCRNNLTIPEANNMLMYGIDAELGKEFRESVQKSGNDKRCCMGESIMLTKKHIVDGVHTTLSIQIMPVDYESRAKMNSNDKDVSYRNFLSSLSLISVSKSSRHTEYMNLLSTIPKYSRWFYPFRFDSIPDEAYVISWKIRGLISTILSSHKFLNDNVTDQLLFRADRERLYDYGETGQGTSSDGGSSSTLSLSTSDTTAHDWYNRSHSDSLSNEYGDSAYELTKEQIATAAFYYKFDVEHLTECSKDERSAIVNKYIEDIIQEGTSIRLPNSHYINMCFKTGWNDVDSLAKMEKRGAPMILSVKRDQRRGVMTLLGMDNEYINMVSSGSQYLVDAEEVRKVKEERFKNNGTKLLSFFDVTVPEGDILHWLFDWSDVEFVAQVQTLFGKNVIRPTKYLDRFISCGTTELIDARTAYIYQNRANGAYVGEDEDIEYIDVVNKPLFELGVPENEIAPFIVDWSNPSVLRAIENNLFSINPYFDANGLVALKHRHKVSQAMLNTMLLYLPANSHIDYLGSIHMQLLSNNTHRIMVSLGLSDPNFFVMNVGYTSEYYDDIYAAVISYNNLLLHRCCVEDVILSDRASFDKEVDKHVCRYVSVVRAIRDVPPVGTPLKIDYQSALLKNGDFFPSHTYSKIGCYRETLSEGDLQFMFAIEHLYATLSADKLSNQDASNLYDELMSSKKYIDKVASGFEIEDVIYWHMVSCNPMSQRNVLNCFERYKKDVNSISLVITRQDYARAAESMGKEYKILLDGLIKKYASMKRQSARNYPEGTEDSKITSDITSMLVRGLSVDDFTRMMNIYAKTNPVRTISMTEENAPYIMTHATYQRIEKSEREKERRRLAQEQYALGQSGRGGSRLRGNRGRSGGPSGSSGGRERTRGGRDNVESSGSGGRGGLLTPWHSRGK